MLLTNWKRSASALLLAFAVFGAAPAETQAPIFTPFKPNGIYKLGESAGWKVGLPEGVDCVDYKVERDAKTLIKTGRVDADHKTIEAVSDRPAMLYVTVKQCGTDTAIAHLGAAIDPTAIEPTAPRPADFDQFWAEKLKALDAVPFNAKLEPVEKPVVDVEEYTITLDSIGSKVRGYLAKPKGDAGKKYPALILYQYAGVYALDPRYAAWRAASGWLVLNVSAHDLPPTQAGGLREDYQTIGQDSRDTSYFLGMYLRDCQALRYLASRPDWDGRILVVTGDSMGGQQSLAVAGLNPDKVTAIIVNEPAGADSHAETAGRKQGYPFWAADPKVRETALYFDTVNFASKIKAQTLMGVGFIDSAVPPTGVWTVFNQIDAPKEMVGLVTADHMHITPEPVEPFRRRVDAALEALRKGESLFGE